MLREVYNFVLLNLLSLLLCLGVGYVEFQVNSVPKNVNVKTGEKLVIRGNSYGLLFLSVKSNFYAGNTFI